MGWGETGEGRGVEKAGLELASGVFYEGGERESRQKGAWSYSVTPPPPTSFLEHGTQGKGELMVPGQQQREGSKWVLETKIAGWESLRGEWMPGREMCQWGLEGKSCMADSVSS